jgi:hypothetical protein
MSRLVSDLLDTANAALEWQARRLSRRSREMMVACPLEELVTPSVQDLVRKLLQVLNQLTDILHCFEGFLLSHFESCPIFGQQGSCFGNVLRMHRPSYS